MSRCLDVVVLGGGPAGCSTAIELARLGQAVAVLSLARGGGSGGARIGDSLSPQARPLLHRLGLWSTFEADGHLPCHANRSAWGTDELQHLDFIRHPQGHGFHVDRERFDQRLQARAQALGVGFVALAVPPALTRQAGQWQLSAPGWQGQASWLVDATGRSSWLARRQGASRLELDRQVAVVAWLRAGTAMDDGSSLIEAVADGWWYSAPLPGGLWSTAFFTDADLHPLPGLRTEAGWRALLRRAPHTHARLQQAQWQAAATCVPAGSACLHSAVGLGWLAVGDAAIRYDPLSAHGLTVALASGLHAAQALGRAQAGDGSALPAYDRLLRQAFDEHALQRQQLYCQEMRFARHPYWARRQQTAFARAA